MSGFFVNIEKASEENSNFRQVLFTGKYSQLVVMSLKPGEEIGMEVHENVDQFFRVEEGEAKIIADSQEKEVSEGDAFVIPAGTQHNVINTSANDDLKLYTIYSPANHPDKTVHKTKKEALEYEKEKHH
ncbi:MAG: cupin domain-containing protein [Patescibacteria group bacterium]|nr:cupin domain-containing protein [Patescibacteria group bacterium]